VAADAASPRAGSALGPRVWLAGTITLTLGAFVAAIALAPPASAPPARGLTWLLFVGSSVHVASTGWLYTLPEVRGYARERPARLVLVPAALIIVSAATATLVSPAALAWCLLPYYGWQFFHFQKQNLGLTALAAAALRIGSPASPGWSRTPACCNFGSARSWAGPTPRRPRSSAQRWRPASPLWFGGRGEAWRSNS
jgi:hypothetical protein